MGRSFQKSWIEVEGLPFYEAGSTRPHTAPACRRFKAQAQKNPQQV